MYRAVRAAVRESLARHLPPVSIRPPSGLIATGGAYRRLWTVQHALEDKLGDGLEAAHDEVRPKESAEPELEPLP